MTDEQTYLQFAQDLARKAGDIMRRHLQIGIAAESKEDGSPVTIADTEIDNLVVEAVKSAYPDHAILREEGDISSTPAEYTWVCDPLDGTQPYTFGVPVSMFSLALVKKGVPILGVMYDPYEKRMYHAIKGEGAYLDGEKITVNDQVSLAGSHVALPGSAEELLDSGGLLQEAIGRQIKTFTFVCVTAEAALVATGQIAANVYGHNSPWDIAAIKLIVEEAGGKVTSLSGDEQRYDQPIKGAIVSNGLVHDDLVSMVKEKLW
jgi:histidinol-phosphatase